MKVTFWLLDANAKMEAGMVEIWLWGIDPVGNRLLIVDRNFASYFYAVVLKGFEAQKLASELLASYGTLIKGIEVVGCRFFGKPVMALKIDCKDASKTGEVARKVRTVNGVKDVFEDDIRAVMRYLVDNDVVPCGWHEVDAVEEKNPSGVRANKIYAANSPPKQVNNPLVPALSILAFSLICYSREGSPKPERNPALIISTVTSNGAEKQFIVDEERNDRVILEQFINYIREFDPDIIVNYGANTVDWNYLKGRCRKLGLKLDFDRAKFEPHTSVYGHVSTTGIVNLDLADFTDVFPEVKVKTLWNFADYFGVYKEAQEIVEDVEFADYWDDMHKRPALVRFGLDSARKIYVTSALLLDFAMQLAGLTSLPLDHVMTAAVGFRVDWFLIKQAQTIGELIPKRVEQPYLPYVGGLVLQPKAGLHENIAVLDFKSMYPNIMLTYNLSPDTYIPPNEPEPAGGVYVAPEVNHKFRKSPPGFYTKALTYLINTRNTIRQTMKTLNPQTVEYRVLDARQKAVKILTNAAYGYAGWVGARWYIKPVAEAASAWGRHIIMTAMKMAQDAGVEVVYGDTDSLFLSYQEPAVMHLQDEIKRDLRLEVEVGEVYKRIFFTEAKKRYAGLRHDGSLDIVGLEVIRGDWAKVAKTVQEHVLEIILKENSPAKAVQYVHTIIAQIRNRQVPFENLIIWKTLTKPPQDYAVKAPHVEAAKMLKDKGWRLTGGDKVGYVVLSGKGRLYGRVKPYVFASYDEVDVDYYVTNQVVPAAARVLAFFNVTIDELLKGTRELKETRSLTDFF